jgi:hypothetical protein
MWLGLRSRFLAVKNVVTEIRKIAPIYQRLFFQNEQLSLHDTNQDIAEIPLLETIALERADTSIRTSVAPTSPRTYDDRSSSYSAISQFYPGRRDL